MIAATVLAVFFVPVFYVVIQRLSEWRTKPKPATAAAPNGDGESSTAVMEGMATRLRWARGRIR